VTWTVAIAAIAATAVIGPVTSAAATRHVCPVQVSDRRGDAQDWMLPNHAYYPEADVLSVQLSPGGSYVGFTWKLASVSSLPTRVIQLLVIFRVGQGRSYAVSAVHALDGDSFQDMQWDSANNVAVQGSLRTITGSINTSAGTITASVPMKDLSAHKASAFFGFFGLAGEDLGSQQAEAGKDIDDYSGSKTYVLGRNGC
jgi:hypothetical protein